MLILPLMLMLWSQIQINRSVYDPTLYLDHLAQLKSHPDNSQLHEFLQRIIDTDLKAKHFVPTRKVIAQVGLGLSFLSLFSALFCFLKIQISSLRAKLSEQYLYSNFTHTWQRLTLGLRVYVYSLVANLMVAIGYEVFTTWSETNDSAWFWTALFCGIIFLFPLLISGNLIYRIHKKWAHPTFDPSIYTGRQLKRQDFPKLWQWVENLAVTLKTPVPDHIIIGLDDSFFVTSTDIVLLPSKQTLTGHTLYLPLLFLTALSQEETQAIIGHELTHFSNQDTIKSREINTQFSLFYAYYQNLRGSQHQAQWIEIPVFWLAEHFLYRFQKAIYHWGRKQEYFADQGGATLSGHTLFAQSLLRVVAISELLARFGIDLETNHAVETINNLLQQQSLVVDEHTMSSLTTHPFDTHPPLKLRLKKLGVDIDQHLISQATRKPQGQDLQWFGHIMSKK